MKLSKNDRNQGGRIIGLLGAGLLVLSTNAATFERTIPAPNGIGNVVALTNALAEYNALGDYKIAAKIWLQPGTYDLSGVYMTSASHLYLKSSQGGMLAGLGAKRDDTVLLGGGEAEAHRVLQISGSNWDWMTVSNLTVTGGWSANNIGGGILGNGTTRYRNLIVSNNYARGSNACGGGGCCYGRAEYCLIADNRTGVGTENNWGGGMYTNGGGGQSANLIQGAFHCVFSNNWASANGGGLHLVGKCEDCVFVGNSANYGGGISLYSRKFTWFQSSNPSFTNTTEIKNCVFRGNDLSAWGHGVAIYNIASRGYPVSNCVFEANISAQGGDAIVRGANMYDCIVTNNSRVTSLLCDCDLERCLVSGNTVSGNAGLIDKEETAGTHTNVNCVFANNVMESYGRISNSKVFVNCTIVGNDSQNGGNYGFICAPACNLSNCILSGNKIGGSWLDIRAIYNPGNTTTSALHMVNCVFVKSQNGVDENWEGLVNCKKVANVRFVDAANGDYTPKTSSAAYDYGLADDWILGLVGEKDIVGNRRVFGNRLDAGAYESQCWPPGCLLIVK